MKSKEKGRAKGELYQDLSTLAYHLFSFPNRLYSCVNFRRVPVPVGGSVQNEIGERENWNIKHNVVCFSFHLKFAHFSKADATITDYKICAICEQ